MKEPAFSRHDVAVASTGCVRNFNRNDRDDSAYGLRDWQPGQDLRRDDAVVAGLLAMRVSAAEDDDMDRPAGLLAEYIDGRGVVARRVDTRLAFAWNGRPPDARLVSGPLTVRWTGYLESETTGDYRIHAFGVGRVRVSVKGRVILDANASTPQWIDSQAIELPYDQHPIEIDYQADAPPQSLAFYWSGPGFELEPLGDRVLYHEAIADHGDRFGRGQTLYQALRCGGCHQLDGAASVLAAPALDRVAESLHRPWLLERLTDNRSTDATAAEVFARRMPHFALPQDEANDLADYVLTSRLPVEPKLPLHRRVLERGPRCGRARPRSFSFARMSRLPSISGSRTGHSFRRRRSVACRTETSGGFFETWLIDPGQLNRDHRMPIFDLDATQRSQLAAFLSTLRPDDVEPDRATAGDTPEATSIDWERGRRLFAHYRCDACHRGPAEEGASQLAPSDSVTEPVVLNSQSAWDESCCNQAVAGRRPGYGLSAAQQDALREYVTHVAAAAESDAALDGGQLLEQNNCLGCHDRGLSQGLLALRLRTL